MDPKSCHPVQFRGLGFGVRHSNLGLRVTKAPKVRITIAASDLLKGSGPGILLTFQVQVWLRVSG